MVEYGFVGLTVVTVPTIAITVSPVNQHVFCDVGEA